MNYTKLLMFVACTIAAGCLECEKNADVSNNEKPASWQAILITADEQQFLILADDAIIPGLDREAPQLISGLTKTEKDSLLHWAYRLATRPVRPTNFCTDYVGSLIVRIIVTDQIAQQCHYSSICEWSTLSRETGEMKKLLSRNLQDVQ